MCCNRPEGKTHAPRRFDCLDKFQHPFYPSSREHLGNSALPTLVQCRALLLIVVLFLVEIEIALTKEPLVSIVRCVRCQPFGNCSNLVHRLWLHGPCSICKLSVLCNQIDKRDPQSKPGCLRQRYDCVRAEICKKLLTFQR